MTAPQDSPSPDPANRTTRALLAFLLLRVPIGIVIILLLWWNT